MPRNSFFLVYFLPQRGFYTIFNYGSLIGLHSCISFWAHFLPSCRTGNVSRHAAEPHKKNLFQQSLYEEQYKSTASINDMETNDPSSQFQDKDLVGCLENSCQFWTDFSKVHYHPRSIYELNGSWINLHDFDNYGIGRNVLSGSSELEEMNERLRFFVEECDHIQVFLFLHSFLLL